MKIESPMNIQAALALNNVGVSLLERGCYRQGMEVLQDGITVLKDLFKSTEMETTVVGHLVTSITNTSNSTKLLQKARGKVLQPQYLLSDATASPSIQTISYQVNGLSEILSHMGTSLSSSQIFLVRMDVPLECSSFSVSNAPDLESAVLLYNFGMAQLLLSRVVPHGGALMMTDNAHRILHLASSIIARRSSTFCDTLEETALLQMGLVVLHGIIQVLVETGMDFEAASVFDRYLKVRDIVGNLEAMIEWYSCLLIAAPAA
jgi:hypothetical protein